MKHTSINFCLMLIVTLFSLSDGYITWIAPRLWLQTDPSPPGSPWPMPQDWSPTSEVMTFDANNFHFVPPLESCDIIDAAIQRYTQWMTLDPDAGPADGLQLVSELRININQTDECTENIYPYDGMDESYELNLYAEDEFLLLESESVWGALRGLETFSQLIYLNENNENMLNKSMIRDFPRFGYRGFMVDTSRHFLTMPVIEDIIHAMSWDKLNVLHWHIVDDQAFPYESTTFPNMSQLGAYSQHHVYTQGDVKHVIDYARLYGIRVIPEFDTPGHTYSWGKGLPELLTPCWGDGVEGGPYVPKWGEHADMETVNPSEEYSYDVMTALWAEVTNVFPDEFVHLGLDETYYSCWESNPNISDWMIDMGFEEYREIEEYYDQRVIQIVRDLNAKIISWQDPIDNNVTLGVDNTRIGVWKDDTLGSPGQFESWEVYMKRVTEEGYDAYLLAPWYLNMISYGEDWRNFYVVEPYNFTEDPTLQEKVLGGSAAAWAEYIDGANALSWLWRGIPSKPLMPGYCGKVEWGYVAASN